MSPLKLKLIKKMHSLIINNAIVASFFNSCLSVTNLINVKLPSFTIFLTGSHLAYLFSTSGKLFLQFLEIALHHATPVLIKF